MARPVEPFEERFWSKVDKTDGCWNWTAKTNASGYGQIESGPRKKRVRHRAHILSYEWHHGFIPDGKLVLHKCDNKLCVNPEHLELGSYSKNLKDAWARGRRKPGKLDKETVLKIFQAEGTQREIAQAFGTTQCTVSHIKNKLRYKEWLR